MAIKRTQPEHDQTYFCSFTCLNWIPLFDLTNLYDYIYNWFSLLNKKHQITGFVIMPNHLHLLIHIREDKNNVNKILGNGKRFLAYEIVKRLKEAKQEDILLTLENRVSIDEKNRKKKHRVFEVSSDIKACYHENFLLQKLNYIHNNPLKGKWKLVVTPEGYPHSSAAFYELNTQHPHIKIVHYKDLGLLPTVETVQ